MRNLVRTKSSW